MKRTDSLLAPIIKNLKIEDAVTLGRIKKEWQEIFEKPVSLHTYPSTLEEGALLINVDSPIWLQQLSFYKEAIIKKLQGFGIRAIRFRLGRVLPENKKGSPIAKKQVLKENDISFIDETVSSIQDVELKNMIRTAIEKSIISRGNKLEAI